MVLTFGPNRSIILGMKLAAYLSQNGIDEISFASTLGVSAKAIRHWVSGNRTPRREQMQKIISATKGAVSPNDFHELVETNGPPLGLEPSEASQ